MPLEARAVENVEEFKGALAPIMQYFGDAPDDERAERFLRVLPMHRMFAAWDGGAIVGGAGAFDFRMSVPGGEVPCAGVTVVGVQPTHRRRGALRAMMRAQLDGAHAHGDAIAALWASEETIYARFGYGLACWGGEATIPREYSAFAEPFEPTGRIRFVDADEALELFPPVYDAVRATRAGMFSRTTDWWRDRRLADPENRREGGGPRRYIVHESGDEVTGYGLYRHKPGFEAGAMDATLLVSEVIGATREATRELWRYLLDIDWNARVSIWMLPVDHPLFYLLANPRRARFRMGDVLWVRVLDVAKALSARSYESEASLVFELEDHFCPWNTGRWRLEGGTASRTDAEPELRLGAAALGSAYLGGIPFAQLAAASRVDELVSGALARADALFRTATHPWCPEIF
jgi:predicted acetyltransferase